VHDCGDAREPQIYSRDSITLGARCDADQANCSLAQADRCIAASTPLREAIADGERLLSANVLSFAVPSKSLGLASRCMARGARAPRALSRPDGPPSGLWRP
jgi:hypothetical protein